jgi:hypothetical protein
MALERRVLVCGLGGLEVRALDWTPTQKEVVGFPPGCRVWAHSEAKICEITLDLRLSPSSEPSVFTLGQQVSGVEQSVGGGFDSSDYLLQGGSIQDESFFRKSKNQPLAELSAFLGAGHHARGRSTASRAFGVSSGAVSRVRETLRKALRKSPRG